MGGYNYNFSSIATGYGNETPRETNYVQLSPLLCSGSQSFLRYGPSTRFGLAIETRSQLHGKVEKHLKPRFYRHLQKLKKLLHI
mgnify:CR=1 FL=1